MVEGPSGHQSNGLEIEGRIDPPLETRVPGGVLDGGRTGVPDGAGRGCQTGAGRGPDRVPDKWPDEVAKRGAQRDQAGCQTGCPTGPNGCHVIGHVIFECHVTHLGWQGIILLPTLLSQR
jgi:hypothetical protein